MMRIFLLVLLVGISLAAFPGYRPLNTYKYHYEACMISGFPDTEQRYAGLKIICDAEFYFSKRNVAFLKIRNPQLYEVNGTSDDCSSEYLKISPVSEEIAPLLEKPVKFLYKEGKVETIFCSDEEPEYVLNIKRGILAFINHNFTKPKEDIDEPRMYNNWEYGYQGLCENLYDVQYLTPSATYKISQMKVSKTLNLKNCTKKPFSISSMNVGIGCMKEKCGVIDEPLKISISTSCDMLGKENNFFVHACETSSKYIFAPTHLKGSAATMVKQTLNFRNIETGHKTYPDILDIPHKLKMTSDYENNKTAGINKQQTVSKITQLIEVLIRNAYQKKWQGYHFTALVEMLKKVDKNTLIDIWDQCFDDDHFSRFWLLEALRYVYNEDVFDLIATKIKSQVIDPNQAVSVLLGFAFNNNPSEKMCQDISDLCVHPNVTGSETLKKTCYLVQGAMMHEYCRQKSKTCLENRALELKNRLKSADYREKIYLVKMIGNFGHRSLNQPLLDIIKNTTNTLELRVTAVYALRRIAPRIPQKVLPVLLEIFRDKDSDAELRMACFVIICDSKPGPAVFNLIVKQLSYERTNQVRSFVVSYIKGMAFSNYPCDEKMASTARFALRMLRKYRMGFQASEWIHWGKYSEPLQLGGSFDLQTLYTPSSFLPRAITSKLKIQLLGRSMNLFEFGVRGEGIQELLQRIVERKPESPNQGSYLSRFMSRNPYSLVEKEVREINKMLPTAQSEETKTKGSFYFKLMGKELMHNYFSADDVKHLLEDEAFDIENKFTELSEEGKVFNVTKVFLPLDVTFAQPSAAGIPLKFMLQSVLFMHINSNVKTAVETKLLVPFQASLTGKLNSRVVHSTWGTMKFSLPQLETGSKIKFDVNIASGMGGTLRYNLFDHSFSTKLDLPQEKQQIFSIENQGYTFAMYTQPLKEPVDGRSLYRSTPLDGLEIGEVAPDETFNDLVEMFLFPTLMGPTHHHAHYANWTLKTREGKYLSVNDENELTISDKPTVFRVIFIDDNRQFVKLFVYGKGYVKVKSNSTGCLETAEDERYPKLFKVTHIKGPRFIRLDTVVFIHPNKALNMNPSEWTQTAAALNTEQVLLLKNMITGMKPDTEYKDTWRYLTDLPLNKLPSTGLDDEYVFHPRHLKVLYITPVQGKICLRPIRRDESVFTVERQRTYVNELCYGEQMFGMDMCVSGQYTRPLMSHAPIFPFFGPAKFNVSIKPGKSAAQSIQFKFEKGYRFGDDYKTWKAGMYLSGTSPEKKIESKITYDVNNKKTNLTFDLLNMLPWLQRICIASHVISDEKATFDLQFGENCEEYQSQTVITVKEPGRRQLNIATSYEKLPYSVTKLFYKLFLAVSRQYSDRLSDYKILRSARRKVQFVVKYKTEHLVDLELILPSRTLTMDDVRVETGGFIPRGNPLMNLMQMSSPVCTVDYDTFRTFDGVEFQYSSPLRCPHILAKDCVANSFMVLLSKEANASGNKIVEIFVEKQKIRAEYLRDHGIYQIQVGGSILKKLEGPYQVSSVATIVPLPDKKELHVLCENGLQVVIVRGTKVSIRVSPFLFNRTCGMCGDMNAEQYLDLKTPRGHPYDLENKQKYGHLWMVSELEQNSSRVGCHLKKEHIEITETIGKETFQCFTTTPVLRCLKNCQVTESQTIAYPMTCVRSSNKESLKKIYKEIMRRTLDLTGSQVYFSYDVTEHLACDCSVGDKRNI
ncbi:vitellogenin-2-like isoform X3 [Acropora palmata]|uniref:vitellogenin-2-like isoform X3 n=1 Tax=Acropora palmata TaxID=6131 RepID=UPI003D9FE131